MTRRLSLSACCWCGLATALVCGVATLAAADPPNAGPGPLRAQQGGRASDPQSTAPSVLKQDASEPRKITGMVLCAIGAAQGFVGTGIILGFSLASGGGLGTVFGLVIGGPVMGEGLILTAIGIPLWVSGGRQVVSPESGKEAWRPRIEAGPGRVGVTWDF